MADKLGNVYDFTEEQMLAFLNEKPTQPHKFNHFMDHAYFSATVLLKKLFEEMNVEMCTEHLDALTAILMHIIVWVVLYTFLKKRLTKWNI